MRLPAARKRSPVNYCEMIADDPTSPDQCLFGIALPLAKEEFFRRLDPSYPDNYVQLRKKQLSVNDETLWENDYAPTVHLFDAELNRLKEMGVHCQEQFSLKDLQRISGFRVTTLLAHHEEKDDLIELYDGRYTVDEFLTAMPAGFDGIIDLTLCRSISLQTAITRKFPNCLVVANKLDTGPEFRLICYRKTIGFLREGSMNYVDAITKVRLLLIKNDKKK